MKFVLVLVCVLAAVVADAPLGQDHQVAAQYGPPASSSGYSSGRPRPRPSSQYGTPFNSYAGGGGDDQFESANYQFKYDVSDQEYGVQFGHQEARQGDVAQGEYYVLLPDGRTQRVQYVADQGGYRPKISYEDGPTGFGFGRGGGGGGYARGGGYAK